MHWLAVVIVAMILVVAAAMVIVIVPAPVIAVVVAIPSVVVINVAVRAIPIAGVESLAVMTRSDPTRAFVRRAGPIAFMPTIASAAWIPISVNPDELWSRLRGKNGDYPGFGRSADADANTDLCGCRVGTGEQENGKQAQSY